MRDGDLMMYLPISIRLRYLLHLNILLSRFSLLSKHRATPASRPMHAQGVVPKARSTRTVKTTVVKPAALTWVGVMFKTTIKANFPVE
jgi:hypothetical protein